MSPFYSAAEILNVATGSKAEKDKSSVQVSFAVFFVGLFIIFSLHFLLSQSFAFSILNVTLSPPSDTY